MTRHYFLPVLFLAGVFAAGAAPVPQQPTEADFPGLPTNFNAQVATVVSTNAAIGARLSALDAIRDHYTAIGDYATPEKAYRKFYTLTTDPWVLPRVANSIVRLHYLQDDFEGARKASEEVFQYHDNGQLRGNMVGAVANVFLLFGKRGEAIDYYFSKGRRAAAAKTLAAGSDAERDRARKIFLEILADPAAPRGDFEEAYRHVFPTDPDLADKYLPAFFGATTTTTNFALRALSGFVTPGAAFNGDFKLVIRAYEAMMPALRATGGAPAFPLAQYTAMAYCAEGLPEKAIGVCDACLLGNPDLKPEERYQLRLTSGLLSLANSSRDLARDIARLEADLGADVPPKARLEALDRAGCALVLGGWEKAVRALWASRDALFTTPPRKVCTVRFSETPVQGPGGWDALPARPEVHFLDRTYLGSMDFLKTDVSTGNRGETAGKSVAARYENPPTMQVVCDEWGLHFRFELFDEMAREIAAGMAGAGSYEGYLAPRADKPYLCLLYDVGDDAIQFWNSAYDAPGYRRVLSEDVGKYRFENIFTTNSVVTYYALSWDLYRDCLPSDGSAWEYENILWGRKGRAAWNGTASIHGRSTWGRLVFDLPEKARLAILRRQVGRAAAAYAKAKATREEEGVLDHWADAVVGDPDFYAECLAPLVARLDGYAARVKPDMTDADVKDVAENALADWHNLRFVIARLRKDYLARRLAGE